MKKNCENVSLREQNVWKASLLALAREEGANGEGGEIQQNTNKKTRAKTAGCQHTNDTGEFIQLEKPLLGWKKKKLSTK